MLVTGVVCFLILKQPDLGSSLSIAVITLMMLFIGGTRVRHLGMLGIFVLPAFYFLVYRVPYRWTRIVTFINPWKDSQGAGFQLTAAPLPLGRKHPQPGRSRPGPGPRRDRCPVPPLPRSVAAGAAQTHRSQVPAIAG